MSFPVSTMVGRLRNKIDLVVNSKDTIPQDGTQFTVVLSKSPVISGTEQIFINHLTFTTGLNQFIPRDFTQSANYSSGSNLTYLINYDIGEINFLQGSGYTLGSGLNPFAPWATSSVIAYYQSSKYTDDVLSSYLSYAVAQVETQIQIGMFCSGNNGSVPPVPRQQTDNVTYFGGGTYYNPQETLVIAEPLEILQELISQKAAIGIISRERRIGAGNAIKIVDGDTQIDTSVNQRYLTDYVRDLKSEYDELVRWVILNMGDGYNIKQTDEFYADRFGRIKFQYISDL